MIFTLQQKQRIGIAFFIVLWVLFQAGVALAASKVSSAVIYAYHRIDEPEYPFSNINYEQFESHIKELKNGGYYVASLDEIIKAFEEDKKLPEKTVAITFEGGHSSIMEKAVPLLLNEQMPFTIFIAVDQSDWKTDRYLRWDDIRDLADEDFVSFGLHPARYDHVLELSETEVEKQINRAKYRFKDQIGFIPSYFAYPFGEITLTSKKMVQSHGFKAAFGQQSGVASPHSDLFMLPRFAMTESYAGIDRFQLTANALPLIVKGVTPQDPVLHDNPPRIGFTLDDNIKNTSDLSCFATGQGKANLEIIDHRVEVRLKEPFSQDRARLNCTLPAGYTKQGIQKWRWFGMLFSLPQENDDELLLTDPDDLPPENPITFDDDLQD